MERTKPFSGAVQINKRLWRTAPRFSHRSAWIALLLVALLASGCVTLDDPETAQDQSGEVIATIQPGDTFEQVILPRRPGLSQITLFVSGSPPENDTLWLDVNLFDAVGDGPALVTQRLAVPASNTSTPLNIRLPLQQQSAGRAFRLQLSIEAGELQIYGRRGDQYPYGQSFLSGDPLQADAGFRTSYFYDVETLLDDLTSALPHLWLALPAIAVLFLPGWAVLGLLGLNRRFQLPEAASLSLGLSLAFFPVLMAWTSATGIAWSQVLLAGMLALLGAAAIFRIRKTATPGASPVDNPLIGPSAGWTGLLLAIILIASLIVRFLMIRNISAPPWVDSVHHGLIARLILENGGYPQSFAPYLDIAPTAYHPGFHSVLAAFLWLSNLSIDKGMLYLGQILNALAVISVYLAAVTFTRDRTAGLSAAVVAGFLTPMPAYYTSWGRYPQLAGLMILAAAFALVAASIESVKERARSGSLQISLAASAGLAAGGLFITHYRVAVFLAVLLLAHWLAWLISQARLALRPIALDMSQFRLLALPSLYAAGFCALAGGILALPWLPPAVLELLLPKLDAWRGSPAPAFSDFTWSYLTAAYGLWALRIAAVGLGVGLIRRQPASLSLPLWVALMLVLANLDSLGLPGSGLVNDASVTISLFLPIAVGAGMLVGGLSAWVLAVLPEKLKPAYAAILVLAGAVLSVYAARALLPLLNPVTILYRQEDQIAIQWVAENTPPDETILVNPFAWGYGTYAGQDGAYWISALAARSTIPPPVLYGLGNSGADIAALNQTIQQFIDQAANPQDLSRLMRTQGIRYLVTGRRGGIFSPVLLLESGAFLERYQQNGVWILEAATP